MYDYAYDACMIPKNMKWHVMLKNVYWIMLYHQSVHNNLKTRRERKHISNLIQFFHFSIFLKKTNETFISSFFLFKNKLSYYEKGTKLKKKKPFFLYFFKDSKHIFWFWQESNFRVLITSCNLLTQKLLFHFFLQKNHDTCICFIINLQKKILEHMCLFTCPKFG